MLHLLVDSAQLEKPNAPAIPIIRNARNVKVFLFIGLKYNKMILWSI